MQFEDPADDQDPGSHVTHVKGDTALRYGELVPAAQGLHDDAPTADQLPAEHSEQFNGLEAPRLPDAVPASH